ATGGVTEGSGPVVVPARPLVQIKREPMYVRRRIGLALLLTIVVLGLVGAGVGGWWWRVGRWTEQPAVLGFDATDARSLLVGQGFQVAADTYAYSEDMGAGLVLSSDPGDGARIIKGGTVSLTISKGPERYTMPTIVGLTQADAAKALADCGAAADEAAEKCPKIGEATGTWDDTVAEGLIVWQSQEPGASLVPGTVVNISYSKGPEPVEVPDYTGQSAADAQAALEALQFVVSVTEEHSADVAEGLVISQTPNSGTGKHGDTIALVQSLGPVMVAVPNVATAFPVTTEDSAKAQITAAGLIPVVEADGGYIVLHIVRGQDPKPGTMVPQGSTVTITVV
ncbi:MAG: PASTA domain-containing protein, partial [Propionibacteriaceae bacterium]|nr:PASTA domain-containing protein [Propionibacteriaceae bacterium]